MYTDDNAACSERLLNEEQYPGIDEKLDQQHGTGSRSFLKRNASLVFQILLFISSASMLLISSSQWRSRNSSSACMCEDFAPQWSPVLEAVDGTGRTERFDGSFARPNAFKGTPSPLIDDSWDNITYASGGVVSISEESLRAANASLDYSVKLAPEIGGGYMASVEVLHQLHCLNMLRQSTYEDYYRDKAEPWTDSAQTLRYHLDHCIDNLRQKLMCDADAGILTYVWVEGHKMPFPDFNVQHRCRDFSAIQRWVEERQVFTKGEYGVVRLPGTQELSSPP